MSTSDILYEHGDEPVVTDGGPLWRDAVTHPDIWADWTQRMARQASERSTVADAAHRAGRALAERCTRSGRRRRALRHRLRDGFFVQAEDIPRDLTESELGGLCTRLENDYAELEAWLAQRPCPPHPDDHDFDVWSLRESFIVNAAVSEGNPPAPDHAADPWRPEPAPVHDPARPATAPDGPHRTDPFADVAALEEHHGPQRPAPGGP